jgi:pyrroloquinoline quinone (PQQ) biosynthesis protein C
MSQEVFNQIQDCSVRAAEGIREHIKNSDLKSYKKFLDQMYHYTLKSGDKILTAAKHAPTEELKNFFNHMYKEERNHYMLAVQDLRGFGLEPSKETPKEVEDFNKFWESLGKGHFNGYLGALYVFENIADKVGDDVASMLKRLGVAENQKRWLSIHIEADEEHGALSTKFLKQHLAENPQAALDAAKEAADRWIAVNRAPFLN